MNQNFNDNEKDNSGNSSSISSDLIRGHINTIILRTLYDGDKYGYEIINEIEEKSKGQYSLKQPTLYSALKRLESQDFVTSYWGGVSNGGRRKYFQITDKGRKIVEQNLAEWEYSRTVIDSLISEKDYDFNNPPPAASVDFNLLKKSTTRVPIMRGDESDDIELEEEEFTDSEEDDIAETPEPADKPADTSGLAEPSSAEDEVSAPDKEQTPEETDSAADTVVKDDSGSEQKNEEVTRAAYAEQSRNEVSYTESSAVNTVPSPTIPESPIAPKQETPLTEEEKQRIHENYKVLIGEDTDATNYYYTHVAQRNREDRNTFDKSVFGNEQQGVYPDQQNAAAYAPQQDIYAQQQPPENYYPQEPYAQAPQQPYPEEPPADTEQYAPYMEPDNSSDLLYANKSPAERNYKSLLSRLYDNTIKPHDEEDEPFVSEMPSQETFQPEEEHTSAPYQEQTTPPPAEQEPPAPQRRGNTASSIEFYDVEEKAENDGLRITTTNGARNRTIAKSVGNTFDKGKALFLSAVYVFIIALAESIVNICLQNVIHSNTAYVVVPFVIDFVMLGVFLFLYLRGYGKNSRKTQSKSYISASLIVFVNLILIICLIAYLVALANDNALHLMIYAIFPCVYMFNIPLFAIFYNYHCNKN